MFFGMYDAGQKACAGVLHSPVYIYIHVYIHTYTYTQAGNLHEDSDEQFKEGHGRYAVGLIFSIEVGIRQTCAGNPNHVS